MLFQLFSESPDIRLLDSVIWERSDRKESPLSAWSLGRKGTSLIEPLTQNPSGQFPEGLAHIMTQRSLFPGDVLLTEPGFF